MKLRKFRKKFGKKGSAFNTVKQFVKGARKIGSLLDKTTRSCAHLVQTTENIPAIARRMSEQPSTSTRYRSKELNISRTSLRITLHKDFGLKPCKVQLSSVRTETT